MKQNPKNLKNTRFISVLNKSVMLSIALLMVNGCSEDNKPAATQIIAKVNADEISIHQLNNSMAQVQGVAPEQLPNVRLNLVDKLVNEQLAVQQALLNKLDRSAEVMMQIEAARREILTKAYLKQVISGLPAPGTEEIEQFYVTHPELFAERRVYNLQQISIPAPHPAATEIKQLVTGKSMTDIVTALKQQNIPFTAGSATRAAEQIPLPVLSVIAKAPQGQISFVETPQSITIARVEASQASPLSKAAALQRIPQYLSAEQAKVAISSKLEQLKKTASITYLNEFAHLSKTAANPAAPAAAVTAVSASAGATNAAEVKPVATKPAHASANSSDSITRGISGMH